MASSLYFNTAAQELELESECPICLQSFVPPVYQCNNGHVVCHNCLPQCKKCSICREPMPKDKVRSLQFEKILVWIANASSSCPRRGDPDGCNAVLKNKESVEKHLLECSLVPTRLCLRLGLACFEGKYCTGKNNELIEHLVFEHKLDGLIGDGNHNSSSATLELEQTISMSRQNTNFLLPNFIRFDDNMFFVKKYLNLTEGLITIVVYMNEPLTTARNYSALIRIMTSREGVRESTLVSEFKQKEIVLLTQQDEVHDFKVERKVYDKSVVHCTIHSSTFDFYNRQLGKEGRKLKYKVRVTVFKN